MAEYIYIGDVKGMHSPCYIITEEAMKSLLDYIPLVIRRDPVLARIILDMEYLYMFTMALLGVIKPDTPQEETNRKRKRRSTWVRPYLRRRIDHGHYANLMQELSGEDRHLYRNFMRLEENLFNEIVERLRPHIEKKTTRWRDPLDVGLRVAITLRFLATGNSYKSLGYSFRVAPNTISLIVPETCKAIVAEYGADVLQLPTTPDEWKMVAKGFEDRWHFPHAIGAIDGKHIRIRNPYFSGSVYYNYKKFFSMVLLALVDANYNFIFIDVGAVGAESDAGIFARSKLFELFNNTRANLPPPEHLPRDPQGTEIDYFMVGDDAFALKSWMMKPYPSRGLTVQERIFNYRLSRARRVVENAFGILASRFRVFHTPIALKPDHVESVILASCVLHNLIRKRNPSAAEADLPEGAINQEDDQPTFNQGDPFPGIDMSTPWSTQRARSQRDYLRDYFSSPLGSVPWQMQRI